MSTRSEKATIYMKPSETGLDGPDQVLQSEVDVASEASGRVRIKLEEKDRLTEAVSVPGLVARAVKKYGDSIALVAWPERKTWTYKEYEAEVRTVARAFLALGLERYHSVGIIGLNSPQWLMAYLAAIYAGGLSVGLYTTNSAEACYHCAESSSAQILVVDNRQQLAKISEMKHRLPKLRAIVQYDGTPVKEENVYSWEDVLRIGQAESPDRLDGILKTLGINECCTLIYTSGTVGLPKAVMLSHDNLIRDSMAYIDMSKEEKGGVCVSYLPLSHIAGQMCDIVTAIDAGRTVYFADKNALKSIDTLFECTITAKPTVFLGVPRVWEKMYESLTAAERSVGMFKAWMIKWARQQGLTYHIGRINGTACDAHWGYLIAERLVLRKIKANIGLDRCKILLTGAAPLSAEIHKYFMSLDMPLVNLYGMSEASGPHTGNTIGQHYKLGYAGRPLPGLSVKLANVDDNGEGEICLGGRNVFMGYLNEPEKTSETKDEDGWLHSGDIGSIDANGNLCVTGRIKELVITAGGENVPPVPIEQTLLAELATLGNAMLVGDGKKFLSILVTLKTNVDPNTGVPLDTLTETTRTWAKSVGSKATTVAEILKNHDPPIYREIESALGRTNAQAVSNAQKLQKFRILPNDFSIPTGELGPTLKMRRNIIAEKYKHLIEEIYE